jgi:hypothetical protein
MSDQQTGFEVVDVWVGVFSTPEQAMEYIEDQQAHFDDETSTVPISKLAADMGEWFIDHDFLGLEVFEEPEDTIAGLLSASMMHDEYGTKDGQRIGEEFIAELYAQQNGAPVNTIVLVHDEQIKNPKSVRGADYWLHYIGRFYDQS